MPKNYPTLFKSGPLPIFVPPALANSAGYTQRLLVQTGSYSGARTLQTYMPAVTCIQLDGFWLHTLSDASVREGNFGTAPFQAFHIYTTSLSSPDGDLAYKKGDSFVPNGNLVGLVANTVHTIAGVQEYPHYTELIVWRKL